MIRTIILSLLVIYPIVTQEISAETPIKRNRAQIKKIHDKAKSYIATDDYVHTWEPLWPFKGELARGGDIHFYPIRGQIELIFFIASWCTPCQEIIPQLKGIEHDFAGKEIRISYIFSHDVKEDVLGFLEAYSLKEGIISNHDILKAYHNPPLPTAYIGDGEGWMTHRLENLDKKKISELHKKLTKMLIL